MRRTRTFHDVKASPEIMLFAWDRGSVVLDAVQHKASTKSTMRGFGMCASAQSCGQGQGSIVS
jgi:hypothetical protein